MDTILAQQQDLSVKNSCVEFMFSYQQRNVVKMLSFCDPGGSVYFEPLGDAGTGTIGELGKNIWTALIDSFPDIDNTLDAIVADDENVIRCQVMIRGTQAKDFAGIKTMGQHFDSDHIFIFHLNADNKIDSIRISWDHADFKKQLGA